jgi:glycerophosphoryl diester phosphodiesterase
MMESMVMQVLAHRGASKAERENTVAAFRRAASMGANAAELDVRRTSDGVLVVHHNPDLVDGRLICATPARDLPVGVPTLDEALDACAPMWVNVEIKNDPGEPDFDPSDTIADATVACLQRRPEGSGSWLISSFRRETIDRCRHVDSTIATAWLTPGIDAAQVDSVLADLVSSGHSALHPWVGLLTKELVDACHRHGLAVNTWTCDDPERMVELASWSVDGVCTNVPDVALATLTRL